MNIKKAWQSNKQGHSSVRYQISLGLLISLAMLFSFQCAAGDPKFTTEAPANFWLGLWHGAIAGISFIVSLFSDTVKVYEIDNNGSWYDFGFLFGVVAIWGGGSAKSYSYGRGKSDICDDDWEKKMK